MNRLKLPARKPFNFTSVINSHGWRQLAPFSYDENTNTLGYTSQMANGRVVQLTLRDGVDAVIVETDKLERTERKEVLDKVTSRRRKWKSASKNGASSKVSPSGSGIGRTISKKVF